MKTSLTMSVLLFFFLLSCSKNDAKENLLSQSGNENFKIERMFSEKNLALQKQFYNLLTKEEKFKAWSIHMERMQQSGKIASSQQKVSLLRELTRTLTPETFEETKERDVFLSYHLPRWKEQAQIIFSAKEIYDIIESPNNPESVDGYYSDIPEASDGKIDCFCHIGNDGYSCKKIVTSFPNGTTIRYGICESTPGLECEGSRFGCGALWLESCNGALCNF